MPSSQYQWHGGNSLELYENGPAFFPRMLDRINQAVHSIDLEIYLIERGANERLFMAALRSAAERGVAVRLLVDGLGSKDFLKHNSSDLIRSGIQLKVFNPMSVLALKQRLHRDHRKILLLDRQELFIGGAGITDQFWNPEQGTFDWREVMVWAQGPVVGDALDLFEHQWTGYRRSEINEQPAGTGPSENSDGYALLSFVSSDHEGLVKRTNQWVETAQHRLWFITPYFLPRIAACKRLTDAAKRGVDVRLYLPGPNIDHASVRLAGRSHYDTFLDAGIKIFEGKERFSHAKILLIDQRASIGSCNFDFWGLGWNREANLEVQDAHLIRQTEQLIDNYQRQSHAITRDIWKQRPPPQRCMTTVAGVISKAIERCVSG